MKVNKASSYNSSIQFKALRLRDGSERYINVLPNRILNKLDNIGKYIANTQFYHLDIVKDGFYIGHANGDRLYQPFLVNNAGQVLIIKAKQGLSQIIKKLKFKTTKEVTDIEEILKKAPTQIERTAEIIKVLDDYDKKIAKSEENIVIDLNESREEKIKKLIMKYKG